MDSENQEGEITIPSMRCSASREHLYKALSAAQGEFEDPAKSNKVDFKVGNKRVMYSYANLGMAIQGIRTVLAKHGLSFTQYVAGQALVTHLAHSSGQWMEVDYPIRLNGKPQEQGSTITYARRYSLFPLLGIAAVEDDDDGKAGQDQATRRPAALPDNAAGQVPKAQPKAQPKEWTDSARKRYYAVLGETRYNKEEMKLMINKVRHNDGRGPIHPKDMEPGDLGKVIRWMKTEKAADLYEEMCGSNAFEGIES